MTELYATQVKPMGLQAPPAPSYRTVPNSSAKRSIKRNLFGAADREETKKMFNEMNKQNYKHITQDYSWQRHTIRIMSDSSIDKAAIREQDDNRTVQNGTPVNMPRIVSVPHNCSNNNGNNARAKPYVAKRLNSVAEHFNQRKPLPVSSTKTAVVSKESAAISRLPPSDQSPVLNVTRATTTVPITAAVEASSVANADAAKVDAEQRQQKEIIAVLVAESATESMLLHDGGGKKEMAAVNNACCI